MHPAFAVLANRSLPLSLYDFHLSGVSARQLAQTYDLPLHWVEERLEAVRMCLKFQVQVSFASHKQAKPAGRAAPQDRVVMMRARA